MWVSTCQCFHALSFRENLSSSLLAHIEQVNLSNHQDRMRTNGEAHSPDLQNDSLITASIVEGSGTLWSQITQASQPSRWREMCIYNTWMQTTDLLHHLQRQRSMEGIIYERQLGCTICHILTLIILVSDWSVAALTGVPAVFQIRFVLMRLF